MQIQAAIHTGLLLFSAKTKPFCRFVKQGGVHVWTSFFRHCLYATLTVYLACADTGGPLCNKLAYCSVYSDEIYLEGVFTYSDWTQQIIIGLHAVSVIVGCSRGLQTEELKYIDFIDFFLFSTFPEAILLHSRRETWERKHQQTIFRSGSLCIIGLMDLWVKKTSPGRKDSLWAKRGKNKLCIVSEYISRTVSTVS